MLKIRFAGHEKTNPNKAKFSDKVKGKNDNVQIVSYALMLVCLMLLCSSLWFCYCIHCDRIKSGFPGIREFCIVGGYDRDSTDDNR